MAIEKTRLKKRDWRRSDLADYIRQLHRLGFARDKQWTKNYKLKNSPYAYTRTYWRLSKGTERVLFIISPHKCSLVIYKLGVLVLEETAPTHNWLEGPFMRYFKLEEPICQRRLGKQPKKIRQWLIENPEKNPQNAMLRSFTRAKAAGGPSRQLLKSAGKRSATK